MTHSCYKKQVVVSIDVYILLGKKRYTGLITIIVPKKISEDTFFHK